MKTFLDKLIALLSILICAQACRIRITPLPAPVSPPKTEQVCQAPPIEKNIVGTWHFESNRSPVGSIRTGLITFTAQNHLVDPDSLFENHIDTGSVLLKVVDKTYDTDGSYPSIISEYTGKIFTVNVQIGTNQTGTIWPFYVASNECNKIVIYQLASYSRPVAEKYGFTLTR